MKFAVAFSLVAAASAFNAPNLATRAVKAAPAPKKAAPAPKKAAPVLKKAAPVLKKAALKKAAPKRFSSGSAPTSFASITTDAAARTKAAWANERPSVALPWATAPATLDGSLAGDEGFDPLGLSTGKVSGWYRNFGSGFAQISDLTWMREAELQHGRVAQLAVLGFLWPGFFGTIPGPGFEETNPLKALGEVPTLSIIQLSIFFAALEFRRVAIIDEDGASHIPGDSRFGAGANPSERFVLGQKTYDPEEAARLAQCEVSHCRLAMMGFLGVLLQGIFSGESVADQLGAAFSAPDYYAKAGYFLPEGI